MFSKLFWSGTLERAVKTFAQSLLAALGVGTGLFHMNWVGALDLSLGATALSLLTSLATATTVVATSPLSMANVPPAAPQGIIAIPPQNGPTASS